MLSPQELHEELKKFNDKQLDDIVVQYPLDTAILHSDAVRQKRAFEIWQAIQVDPNWRDRVEPILEKVKTDAEAYFYDRLRHIEKYLLDPPWAKDKNLATGHVKELKEQLEKKVLRLDKPQDVRVRGTLFPAALLTKGWWERKDRPPSINWRSDKLPGLQEWLFQGFDLWAPSWDISWDFHLQKPVARHLIAQLTQGDEADSIPVVIPAEKAHDIRAYFMDPGSWGGCEAEVSGLLSHRAQLEEDPSPEGRDLGDYYITLNRDDDRHKVEVLDAEKTPLYSGYLWKCLTPKEWIGKDGKVCLRDVYFVWEHTNFAARDARQYNLDGLQHKERLIEKEHPGGLVLLQKSHNIVEGSPAWTTNQIYELIARRRVAVPLAGNN